MWSGGESLGSFPESEGMVESLKGTKPAFASRTRVSNSAKSSVVRMLTIITKDSIEFELQGRDV